MYQEFLQYIFIDEPNFTIEKGNSSKYSNNNSNDNVQLESIEYFGKIDILINEILMVQKKILRKEKFSGKKFLDLGIETKQIKKYLEDFKLYISSNFDVDLDTWLDTDVNCHETVDKIIREFINKKI